MDIRSIVEMIKAECSQCNKELWCFPKYNEKKEDVKCEQCLNEKIKELPSVE